jgi:uncharacterized protein YdhG (YjbR/CyaY superfamily)
MTKATTIDQFIAGYPKDVRDILQNIRELIKKEAPTAQEAIVYGIPTFKLHEKNLIHFSGFEQHIGFYPTPAAIEAFKKELSGYKSAKGSVQFPLDKPIPYELIKKIVVFRIKEVEEK